MSSWRILSGPGLRLTVAMIVVATAIGAAQRSSPTTRASAARHVLIVADGLRPDLVTAWVMSTLHALGRRGARFPRHHAVFPTVTRVNAASIATGAYPVTHGLLGNSVYFPSIDPVGSLSTATKETLDAIGGATGGRLLTATTLAEVLAGHGQSLVALSSGTQGSGVLLNHTVADGAVIHPDFTMPPTLMGQLVEATGRQPASLDSVGAQTRWLVDAYRNLVLDELDPEVTIFWMGDLDSASHASGVGSPEAIAALKALDAAIAEVQSALAARERLETTNLWVTSDHGFSTHTGGMDLERLLQPIGGRLPDGTADVVRAGEAVYVRSGDADTIGAIVEAMQRDERYGPIFMAPGRNGSHEGSMPGTLSRALLRWNHARAADIVVSAAWTSDANAHGYPGTSSQSGVAGHGSLSPFDIGAVLVGAGPDIRVGITTSLPSSNVDLAPTILHLMGHGAPSTMEGRALTEALRNAPVGAPQGATTRVYASRAQLPEGRYEVIARVSSVGDHHYLDAAEVSTRP